MIWVIDLDFIAQQDQFIKFIESYNTYLRPAYWIAENNDDESLINVKKKGNSFKLYSLDNICQSRSIFWKNEPNITPKTTDALWFKKGDNGDFFIYLIEFKGDKIENKSTKQRFEEYINDLKEIRDKTDNSFEKKETQKLINKIEPFYKKYSDSMLNSLVLKPLETITTSLPLIYKDYYGKNKENDGVEYMDMKDFLRKATINYYVVIFCDGDKEDNPFKTSTFTKTMGNEIVNEIPRNDDSDLKENYKNNLNTYYERYKKAKIFNFYDYLDPSQVNMFIQDTFVE